MIEGPDHHALSIRNGIAYATQADGRANFSPRACRSCPKLYVVTLDDQIVYVGVTRQAAAKRLRQGLVAKGEHGYYGYAWAKKGHQVGFDLWYLTTDVAADGNLDLETIEAEVVFLVRTAGQWPQLQTEIHFHQSLPSHRQAAQTIARHYGLVA
ncbi:MAG TPA: hypothetical protein VFS60_12395 [Thermoanaerobaculia bacterium]|nr:hypothetical protein [Thermoanaerobaculia bacterium]